MVDIMKDMTKIMGKNNESIDINNIQKTIEYFNMEMEK